MYRRGDSRIARRGRFSRRVVLLLILCYDGSDDIRGKQTAAKKTSPVAGIRLQHPRRIFRYILYPQQEKHIVPYRRGDSVISKVVGYIKMNASKEIHRQFGNKQVWQRSYYDHVIRNQADYDEIAKYISENPLRWELDKLYSEE